MADTPPVQPTTPDYSQQNLTPPATPPPTADASLSGIKLAPATFKRSFVAGLKGPQYTTDSSGNIIPQTQGSPSGRGLLGSVLAGAVMGALHGAAATKKGERGGVAFGSGVRMDQEIRDEQAEQSKKQAQQSFANRQSTQKLTMEQQEAQDKHNQAVLTAHQISAVTAKTLQDTQEEADTHPYEIALKKAGLDEDAARLSLARQTLQTNDLEIAKNVEAIGMDPTVFLSSYEDAQANIGRMHGENPQFAIANGLPPGDPNRGASMYNVSDLNRPLPRDVSYYSYDKVDKDGNPVPTKHTLVANGQNTIKDYMSGAMQGQLQLHQTEDALKSKADIANKQAETQKAKADAGKANADAELSRANAEQLRKFGASIPPTFKYPEGGFALGPDALQSNLVAQGVPVPPNFQTLYAIGHYDADLKTEAQRLYKGGAGMTQDEALNWIRSIINPKYDQTVYAAAQEVEKEFSSSKIGTAGGSLTANNAAVQHLGQLYDAGEALDNHNLVLLNKIANDVGAATGHSPRDVFNAIKTVLSGETAKTLKNASATDKDTENFDKTLNMAQSPEETQNVSKAYAHALLAKSVANSRQYTSMKGHLPPRVLDPEALAVYAKMGIDAPSAIAATGAPSPAGATGNTTPQIPAGAVAYQDAQGNIKGYVLNNKYNPL